MAPNEYSIFDINSAFGVDEVLTNRSSSSIEAVMPQFYEEASATSDFERTSIAVDKALATHRTRPTPNPWDPRLVMDLALGLDPLAEILDRYEMVQDDYDRLCEVPSFRRDLAVTMRELRENGVTFGKKAAIQAESYLLDVDDMVQDKSIPASTRLTAIQWMARMGRLEPKEEKSTDVATGTQVTLNITFANNAQVANIGGH
jgi:hypothetical protein